MLQAALAEFPATGHVLNPIDWAEIELTKITDGGYLFANPQNDSQPRLWGLPVVETQAMTAGNFLTGAFRLGAQIFDRQDARRSEEHTSELQSLMRNSYAVFCLKKKTSVDYPL